MENLGALEKKSVQDAPELCLPTPQKGYSLLDCFPDPRGLWDDQVPNWPSTPGRYLKRPSRLWPAEAQTTSWE